MKVSMRKSIFSVPNESYTLSERLCIKRKHGDRYKKQHYLSKLARNSIKLGRVDGINLINKEYYD